MIERIDITSKKYQLDDAIKKYVNKKIGRLDRFMPRHARKTAHADVILRQPNLKHGNKYECEVILHLPDESITVSETTMNMFAAVDIVEEKLKNQLKRYKDLRLSRKKGIGLIGRLKRRQQRPESVIEDIVG